MESDISRDRVENVQFTTHSTATLERKDEEYEPFEHRTVAHPTSTIGSFFHLLKSSLGSGLLAMPAAFSNTGIVPGCIGTFLVAVIATHCVHILVWLYYGDGPVSPISFPIIGKTGICRIPVLAMDRYLLRVSTTKVFTSREVCKESRVPSLSYTDTCERVFKLGPTKLRRYSTHVRHFADAAMAGVCLGGTAVYVLFIASTLENICNHFVPDNKLSLEAYCGILLLPLILITQIRYLKFLVPFSVLANICLVLTFGITCYYTFMDVPKLEEVEMMASVVRWPLFLSTAIFAMEGINVVMPVENEMAKPQDFLGCPGVLTTSMAFVATLYGIVGVFGYMKYGDKVQGIITLNLPQDEVLALAAKVLVAVAVFFTYCLQMYAPMDIIWTRLKGRVGKQYHNVGQMALRTVSVTFTVILAVAVPDLENLIRLVGAIFFSTLGILIPIVVQTVHRWEKGLGRWNYILWKNGLLLLVYVIVLISGCFSAIREMVAKPK